MIRLGRSGAKVEGIRDGLGSREFNDYACNYRSMNRILALDFGRARIGVAISDELQLLAHPLETISANQQPAARIAEIVREKKVDHVVAGIPRQMNGRSVLLRRGSRVCGKATRDSPLPDRHIGRATHNSRSPPSIA